ncbi:MAG: hypothetical protein AMXMBFR64_23680 [Myxococcales bacterium]
MTKHGLTDPDAVKLFDTSGITIDTGGNLIGLDAVVAKWKEAKPYAFKPTAVDGKAEGGAGGAGKLPNLADKKGTGGKDKTPTTAELASPWSGPACCAPPTRAWPPLRARWTACSGAPEPEHLTP